MTLERRIGAYFLMNGWYIIMAGNRQEDRGEIHEVPGPLKNRIVRVYVDVHFGDWFKWALTHDVDERIVSYLSWKVGGNMEDCSNMDDHNATAVGQLWNYDPLKVGWNWPTPRAWSMNVNYYLKKGALQMPALTVQEILGGCIGEGAAVDFMAYLNVYRKLSPPEKILDGTAKFPPISQPELAYATAISLVQYVKGKKEKLNDLADLLLTNDVSPEFGMLIIKQIDAVNMVIDLIGCKSWSKLAKIYGGVF
jgi:hypothetical protein